MRRYRTELKLYRKLKSSVLDRFPFILLMNGSFVYEWVQTTFKSFWKPFQIDGYHLFHFLLLSIKSSNHQFILYIFINLTVRFMIHNWKELLLIDNFFNKYKLRIISNYKGNDTFRGKKYIWYQSKDSNNINICPTK